MDRLAPKGTQKNINIQFLRPWPVLVPPDDEQREIVAILDAIDRKINLHRREARRAGRAVQGAAAQADGGGGFRVGGAYLTGTQGGVNEPCYS